jgi:cyclopropane-fatty-acyl-phospholipid synthase
MAERGRIPDALLRRRIRRLCAQRLREELAGGLDAQATRFAERIEMLRHSPVAIHTDAANAQHYELPPAFFQLCLGKRLKYSSCYYPCGDESLEQAEDAMLALYGERAELADGQGILELGCGWGSLTLWMAERYPNARITAVSNSSQQREHIEARAREQGLTNLRIITADMNVFETDAKFDRIVSVEMFEHMSNWRALLERCRVWLKSDGRMFMHVFAHRTAPYRFDVNDPADWVAHHFFAGGVMPSRDLIANFPDLFEVEQDWWWNGKNYEETALDWLKNFDANRDRIRPILQKVYGADAKLWENRWRLFFLATAGLFGHAGGNEWGVVHHRLKPV